MGTTNRALKIAAAQAMALGMMAGGEGPYYNPDEVVPESKDRTLGKGHYRNNYAQKKRSYNLRKYDRRRKNKAAKKARRKNR